MQPQNQEDPHTSLMGMVNGYWVSRCLFVAAELGISDHLTGDTAKSINDLASLTQADAKSLYRVMRALAGVGIYAEIEPFHFINTPKSALLQSKVPGGVRPFVRMALGGEHFEAWGDLMHSVRTGETGVKHVYGMEIWQYFNQPQNNERSKVFNESMSALSENLGAMATAAYDFSPYSTIVDIGGGYGSLIASILKSVPNSTTKGMVFDLESVVSEAKMKVSDPVLIQRCEFVAGDFFKSVVAGADLYIMKWIIHDWSDEDCKVILNNVRKAMKPDSKLLILDSVIETGNVFQPEKFMDVNMLVMTGGKERTEQEFSVLLSSVGLRLQNIYNRGKPLCIVECVAEQ